MSQIFISHAVADRPLASALRSALTARGFRVWSGPRTRPDGEPDPGVRDAIRNADHILLLLTPQTAQDRRVREEIRLAGEQGADSLWGRLQGWMQGVFGARERGGAGRIIPLLYPGVMLSELRTWFEGVPVGLPVRVESGDLEPVLPMLLASLGEPVATPAPGARTEQVDELTLRLVNPARNGDGSLTAIGALLYQPASGGSLVESHAFPFQAPVSPLPETLDWYLRRYPLWSVGRRRQRAQAQEQALRDWGESLYRAMLTMEADRDRFTPWLAGQQGQRRFTVEVDSELPLGSEAGVQQQAEQAATELLGLPWELLHDGDRFLLQANPTVPIRRRLPGGGVASRGEPPVRVLYLAPRPADRPAPGYRDTVLALVDSDIHLTRLEPLTGPALERLLKERGGQFQVLHLDGELVLDVTGEPHLILESTSATAPTDSWPVTRLLGLVQPTLVVLQLHGDASAGHRATGQLLAAGVGAVLLLGAGSTDTARCFLPPFYRLLVQGMRLGEAVLAGRRALHEGSGRLRLLGGAAWPQDWFIPMLYQNQRDLRLIGAPSSAPTDPLPPPPTQGLSGRHREFLTLERLLRTQPLVVVSGMGGIGKSTLVAAMAQWLTRTTGFRSARVDIREIATPAELLAAIAGQLALGSVPATPEALGLLLAARATVVVLDHVDVWPGDPVAPAGELLALCRAVLNTAPGTRFLLTARTAPEDTPASLALGAPALDEAVALLAQFMALRDLHPATDDPGDHLAAVEALVAAATGHPRVLGLIAEAVAREGVSATTEALRARRRQLAAQYSDTERVLPLAMALAALSPERREQARALAVFQDRLHREVLARTLDLPETSAAGLEAALVQVGLAQRGPEILYLDPALPGFLQEQLSGEELESLRERWLAGMQQLALGLLDRAEGMGDATARVMLPSLLPLLEHWQVGRDEALPRVAQGLHRLLGEQAPAVWRKRLQELARITPEEPVVDDTIVNDPDPTVDTDETPPIAAGETAGSPPSESDTAPGASPTEPSVAPEAALPEPPVAADTPPPTTPDSPPPADWSHQHFEHLRRQVEQFLTRGELDAASDSARHLLTRSLTAGDHRYPEAPVDVAAAYFTYARTLRWRGTPRQALEPLRAAQRRLAARDGHHLMAGLEAELGECYLALGEADQAMDHYRRLVQTSTARGDPRGQLLGQLRLGTIQLSAGHREAALATLRQALESADADHPARADIQQLLAATHRQLGDFDVAEQLVQDALERRIRRQDRGGEAMALAELANLFDTMGRLEDAARLASQAAGIAMELGDALLEGQTRHNLGETLLKLGRLPEARLALEQALSHKLDQGAEAEPWKTWHLLARLDTLQGKPTAADARRNAVEGFLAHRRSGGLNPHPAARLCEVVQALIQAGNTAPRHLTLPGEADLDPTQGMGLLLDKLRTILTGERDTALAEDPRLHYQYAAELRLLLEQLAPATPNRSTG